MDEKYSIEWLYNECMNHRHALGITLKSPLLIDHNEYYDVIIVQILLSNEQEEAIQRNILYDKKNNYVGTYMCSGYLNISGESALRTFNINIEDIIEVEGKF